MDNGKDYFRKNVHEYFKKLNPEEFIDSKNSWELEEQYKTDFGDDSYMHNLKSNL